MKYTLLTLSLLLSGLAFSQLTVGLNLYETGIEDGYTLYSEKNKKTYLINNCGEVLNEWEFSERPGMTCYLLENGNLLRAGKDSLEIRDWDNNLVWSFHVNGLGVNQHHDIEPLPNGNILLLLFDIYDASTMFDAGLRTSYAEATFKMDKIIELQPNGPGNATIVWEWKFFDHLVQDFDNSKANFGVVNDNPQLLDVNYIGENVQDFTHCNAIDYNEDLDQIMLSARHTNELYIIDHSTTTAEAALHTGGTYGKGGDFLWRWGNPETYSDATSADQRLIRQHDGKWIKNGVHAGKVSVFNNGGDGTTSGSSIHVLDVPHTNGVYAMANNQFLPETYDWSWSGSIQGELMQGNKKCGVQTLPNGGALMVETTAGRMSEVTASGDVVWVYEVPHGETLVDQYDTPTNNGIFRAHKYPVDYPGFSGVTFNNTGIIENVNTLSQSCSSSASLDDISSNDISLFPNPATHKVTIESPDVIESLILTDQLGKVLLRSSGNSLTIKLLPQGVYSIRAITAERTFIKQFIKR